MTTLCSTQPMTSIRQAPVAEDELKSAQGFSLVNSLRKLGQLIATRLATRRQQKIDRDAFRHMLTLNDEMLDDIGVTRDAVRWAAQLPLEENAARALRETAQGGSRVEYW